MHQAKGPSPKAIGKRQKSIARGGPNQVGPLTCHKEAGINEMPQTARRSWRTRDGSDQLAHKRWHRKAGINEVPHAACAPVMARTRWQ